MTAAHFNYLCEVDNVDQSIGSLAKCRKSNTPWQDKFDKALPKQTKDKFRA
jgi:hypothetical protein